MSCGSIKPVDNRRRPAMGAGLLHPIKYFGTIGGDESFVLSGPIVEHITSAVRRRGGFLEEILTLERD